MSNTYTQVFGGQTLPSSGPSYSAVTLTASTQFYWPELAVGPAIMTDIMEVSCAIELQLIFPDASVVSVGRTVLICNTGTAQLDVMSFTGSGITTVAAGVMKYIYLSDNSTTTGVWKNITFGAGTSAVDAGTLVGAGLKSLGATLNQVYPTTSQSGTVTLTSSALAKTNIFSGSGAVTCNLPAAATAGDGFFTMVSNQGTGSVSIDPAASDLIDGLATKTLVPGESLFVVSNGTLWVTIGYGRSTQFQFTKLVFDISTGTPFTLTSTQAANKILNFVGTVAAPVVVNVPAVVAIYYVQNTYAGAFSLTIKTAAGTGITLSNSDLTILYCDGTNVVNAQTVVAPASNLAGGSAGVVPYQSGAGTTAFTAAGSAGTVLQGQGASAPVFTDLGTITHAYSLKSPVLAADELLVGDSASLFSAKRATFDAVRSLVGTSFRNRIINGAMKVDQRNAGASQSFTAGSTLAYTVDRFYGYCTGANITGQQVTLANGQNRYRFTGAASNTGFGFGQRIRARDSMDMASQSAVIQAKLSSSSLTTISWAVYYANTTDVFGTLASPTRTLISSGTFTISATEAIYSAAVTVSAGAFTGLELVLTGAALAAGQTVTIGDIQIAQEASVSPFENHSMFDFGLCQQFYQKHYRTIVQSYNTTGTNSYTSWWYPVQMRATPSSVFITDLGSNVNTLKATLGSVFADHVELNVNTISTGYTLSIVDVAMDAEL
jgi:hypothetical protein